MTECNKCFHYAVCNGDIGFGYAECPEFTSKENTIEIVRCKDCEWWTKQEDSAQGRCMLLGIYPTGAWYCGNGRRTEDD